MSKNISGCGEFCLINQSVTGVYEKEIDLLTVQCYELENGGHIKQCEAGISDGLSGDPT